MGRYFNVGDTILHKATGQTGVVADTIRIYGSPNVYITAVVDGAIHTFNSEDLSLVPPMGTASTVEPPKPAVQDPINHPTHYTSHPSGVECITITEHMSFLLGNAMKYIWRADLKGGVEDLKKAVWYVEREIAKREAK